MHYTLSENGNTEFIHGYFMFNHEGSFFLFFKKSTFVLHNQLRHFNEHTFDTQTHRDSKGFIIPLIEGPQHIICVMTKGKANANGDRAVHVQLYNSEESIIFLPFYKTHLTTMWGENKIRVVSSRFPLV